MQPEYATVILVGTINLFINAFRPAQFNSKLKPESSEMIPQDMLPPSDDESVPSDAEEDAPRTFCNPNRPHVQYYDDNDSEDSDENEESVEN